MTTWYRNGLWENGEPSLPIDDMGVFQGVIAVERLRTCGGKVLAFDRHIARLGSTASTLFIDASAILAELPDVVSECLTRNASFVEAQEDVGITILITPGARRGNRPTVIVHLVTLDWTRIHRLRTHGEELAVSTVEQPAQECVPRQAKTRNRLHYYLASKLANGRSDATPVLIDTDGSLTETAWANLLICKDGRLLSPPRDRILGGISLQILGELADAAGIPIGEQILTPPMLLSADEIILTGTGAGVWSGHVEGNAHSDLHPVCDRLQSAFDAFAGVAITEQATRRLASKV